MTATRTAAAARRRLDEFDRRVYNPTTMWVREQGADADALVLAHVLLWIRRGLAQEAREARANGAAGEVRR